jgi:hypothetical protein
MHDLATIIHRNNEAVAKYHERRKAKLDTLNTDKLAAILREAQEAHHKFEIECGETDPDWAAWYAAWIGPRMITCMEA